MFMHKFICADQLTANGWPNSTRTCEAALIRFSIATRLGLHCRRVAVHHGQEQNLQRLAQAAFR